jgi:predicted Rdx family selenoprotein
MTLKTSGLMPAFLALWGLSLIVASAPALHGQTSYTLRVQDGKWWLATPAGRPFFSLGVCCVTPGDPWLDYKPANPGYAAWKRYPDPVAWADATVERLKSWGFTTVGGWSDYDTLKRSRKMDMPYTLVLHMGAAAGAPWWDMWSPKVIAAMDAIARKQILPVRHDPRLLGYYTDNEMGWWNAALFKMTLEHAPQSEQRRRLIALLRDQYHNDWSRLCWDFEPVHAHSFETLSRAGGMLYLRPGGNGVRAVKRFISLVAQRYYQLTQRIIRKYDRRGLILGDRYQSFYYPEVAQAAHDYVDAISTNLNANWNDGHYVRFYLDTLHALARRPVMIGEFYMTAMENGTGNRNRSSGFPVVQTQRERARGFINTLSDLARTPYVVGADWFQFADEPPHGRGDGEDYNMGLVDVEDRPYQELTAAAAAFDSGAVHTAGRTAPADASAGIPPAPQDPLAHSQPMSALREWDRERGFTPPLSSNPQADLYLCWDQDAVYVGLYAIDIVENTYYRDKRIPEADRAEMTLQIGSSAPLRLRIGAGRPPAAISPFPAGFAAVDVSGVDHDVRNVALFRLPAALFGKQTLHAGDRIPLACTLHTFARAYQTDWGGAYTLSP